MFVIDIMMALKLKKNLFKLGVVSLLTSFLFSCGTKIKYPENSLFYHLSNNDNSQEIDAQKFGNFIFYVEGVFVQPPMINTSETIYSALDYFKDCVFLKGDVNEKFTGQNGYCTFTYKELPIILHVYDNIITFNLAQYYFVAKDTNIKPNQALAHFSLFSEQ